MKTRRNYTPPRWSQPSSLGDPDFFSQLGKVPPQCVDIEEAVLGAIIVESAGLLDVIDFLKPQHFYREANQAIYNSMLNLNKDANPIDMLTIVNQLRKEGKLEACGGPYYISTLAAKMNSSENIEYHSRIIQENYIRRALIRLGQNLQHDSYEESIDVFKLLDDAENNFNEVAGRLVQNKWQMPRQLMTKVISDISSRKNVEYTGVRSGFSLLDAVTCGWQKSDFIVIAARPGIGKTAFVLSMIRNCAVDFKVPVALFSLEMSALQLMNRLVASEIEYPLQNVLRGRLSNDELQYCVQKTAALTEAPIHIDDTPGLTIFELKAKVKRLYAKSNIQMVVVDYMQLMNGMEEQNNKNQNREQEIASISRGLKGLAKELNIPIIGVSQLSRAVEARGGIKMPNLSDLRESGAIEQDADVVIFLWRPEYYKIREGDNGKEYPPGYTMLDIAKHRNGSIARVGIKFIPSHTKFKEFEPESTDPVKINAKSVLPDDDKDDLPF